MTPNSIPKWYAKGLLFENCNCSVICPCHVSFKQSATNERCTGYWAIRFSEGAYGDISLAGLCVVVLYDTTQKMYEGNWTEAIYLDESADACQRDALEAILKGRAGGPWEILARFTGTWLETRTVAFHFKDEGNKKSLTVNGLFETRIEGLRGSDSNAPVTLENLYNTIHGPTHTIARGFSRCIDRGYSLSTEGTHAIYSNFSWNGP
jgi:hypothetical protein